METEVRRLLEQAVLAPWFSQVGSEELTGVIQARTWREAYDYCTVGQVWSGTCTEAANEIRRAASSVSKDVYNQWNNLMLDIRPFVISSIEETIAPEIARFNLSAAYEKEFIGDIRWNLSHYGLAAEYKCRYGVESRTVFTDIVEWYMRGHLPCGWDGEYPEGTLIVF